MYSKKMIMKNIVLVSLLILLSISSCKTEKINFYPKWDLGEKKTITIEEKIIYTENSDTLGSQTKNKIYNLEVTDTSGIYYGINLKFIDNDYKELFKKNSISVDDESILIMSFNYEIEKKTGVCELSNWKEYQIKLKRILKRIELITRRTLETKNEDFDESILNQLYSVSEEDNVKVFAKNLIKYLMIPYGKEFENNNSYKEKEYINNLFGQGESPIVYDKEIELKTKSNSIDLISETNFNIEDIKRFLENMFEELRRIDPSYNSEIAKFIFKDFDSYSIKEIVNFNNKTTWVNNYSLSSEMIFSKTNKKAIQTTTISVK
jgi:hypothetical protein